MTTGANRQKIMTARACVLIFCSHANFCPAHFSTSSSCWSDVCHVLHLTPVITISTCHPPVLHLLFGLCLHTVYPAVACLVCHFVSVTACFIPALLALCHLLVLLLISCLFVLTLSCLLYWTLGMFQPAALAQTLPESGLWVCLLLDCWPISVCTVCEKVQYAKSSEGYALAIWRTKALTSAGIWSVKSTDRYTAGLWRIWTGTYQVCEVFLLTLNTWAVPSVEVDLQVAPNLQLTRLDAYVQVVLWAFLCAVCFGRHCWLSLSCIIQSRIFGFYLVTKRSIWIENITATSGLPLRPCCFHTERRHTQTQ